MHTREDLATADQHVYRAQRTVQAQRGRIVRLAANGRDTTRAEGLLETMVDSLNQMTRHREVIAAEFDSTRRSTR
jgi:hypothetical protein